MKYENSTFTNCLPQFTCCYNWKSPLSLVDSVLAMWLNNLKRSTRSYPCSINLLINYEGMEEKEEVCQRCAKRVSFDERKLYNGKYLHIACATAQQENCLAHK